MRVLSISTLFPNPARPSFGIFVGSQMRAVAQRGDVDLVMISPLGMPPWPLTLREPYASLRAIAECSDVAGLPAQYPRFTTIPLVGGDSNPGRIVRATRSLVRKLHEQAPFDLVDASFFFPDGPAAAAIARDLGLPLVIKARGSDIHHWGARPQALRQMLAASDRASALLAVSEALKQDMAALGMPAARIAVHYTGVDHQRFRPVDRDAARRIIAGERSLAIPPGGPLLVSTGALLDRKGQQFAIEALTDLADAQLALAGTGEDEANLRRQAAGLKLSDRVHFLGSVGHDLLPMLLSAADAMVLPSVNEGLANAWVEALACGTPVVIPDVGGAREVVKDASAGRIAGRNARDIAAAVRDLLASPPDQAAVAANASGFSWETNAAQIVELWRSACGS